MSRASQERPDPGLPPGGGPLVTRNFALLTSGQALSTVGDYLYRTTLLIWVFLLTGSSAAISALLLADYAPIFLLGLVAGVFVDRWNRRRTMMVADLLRAGAALLPCLAPPGLRLPAIYASIVLISSCSRFFQPAKSGCLQAIVPESRQAHAASVYQGISALAAILGPPAAASLYFFTGPAVASILNAASFLLSALSLWCLRLPPGQARPLPAGEQTQARDGVRAVWHEFRMGLHVVASTRALQVVFILVSIAMLGAGALNALDILFLSRNLHASASLYGALTAVGGVGTLLGAVGAGLLAKRIASKHLLSGGLFFLGVGLVIYSFQTRFLLALLITLLMALPQGAIQVGFVPLLLGASPQKFMGRVQAVVETAMYSMSLLSIALAGYFGQFLPVGLIFAAGGGLMALAGAFGWAALPRQARGPRA